MYRLQRTTTDDPHFVQLIGLLDRELWQELGEDQSTYDQHNKVPCIPTAVIAYAGDEPVASGCFKPFDSNTVEVKRMFVAKPHRGNGLSKIVLGELERWAIENGYHYAVLETSIRFETARQLYHSTGYAVIPNYGPYVELPESICMKKAL